MKPYRIAEICYNPESPETPWYVVRNGTVAQQGGLGIGREATSFTTIDGACRYLSLMISEDLETIKKIIEGKSS